MEGYCVRCSAKVEMKNVTNSVTSNGRPLAKGKCPQCNTTVTRLLKKGEKA